MKKMVSILAACAFLVSGCIGPSVDVGNNKSLVDKYYHAYLIATNSSNIRIGAMLKAFSTKVNYSPPYKWEQAYTQKEDYIHQVSVGYISENYMVRATDEEIRIVDSFVTDMINVNWGTYPRLFGITVSQVCASYVFRINDYEYDPLSD